MINIHRSRIDDASAWVPPDLELDRSWDITLDDAAAKDLQTAAHRARDSGLDPVHIDRENFPLPNCVEPLRRIRHQLKEGRGFALLHGFPVDGQDRLDVERMYWGFCAHLGTGVTQNGDASLIHYVTEGRLRPNQGTRSVGQPGTVSLHVDLADCVSLLCLRQASDSPHSRLASSTTLHNALLERDPAVLERLYEGFVWDRQNEHDPGETPTTGYRVPMFSARDGVVSCRYNRNWISKAVAREGREFSPEEQRILDLIDELTHANAFEFPFQPGDVQFANNYNVLHGRAPHTPAMSDAEARVLMRIWFNIDGLRPWSDEAIVRYGIVRHGRLGWTASQLAQGLEGRLHPRRAADHAPALP